MSHATTANKIAVLRHIFSYLAVPEQQEVL